MADRYWVGGTGNWSSTTSWSTTSGGTSGASVPTSADNVFFDNNSAAGTFTVTIDTASAVCGAFDASGITNAARKMTLTGTASVGVLTVNGNWTNPTSTYFAWTTWTSSVVTFAATGTITTNSVSFPISTTSINAPGSTVTLGGAFTTTGSINHNNGTFDTSAANNYSLTASNFNITATSATRTLNLNASSVTVSGTAGFSDSSTGGVTLNAGTSTITCSNASPTFAGGGKTFYNVTFSSTALVTATITGSNTFNNLTFTARAAAGVGTCILTSGTTTTVSGTLTTNSGSSATPTYRLRILSSILGSQATISAAAVSLTNTDFRETIASGAAAPFTGTSIGNWSNNSNITFTAAKTVYWSLAAGGLWYATAWATSSGGTPAAANFPLAQDTIYIDNTGLTSGNTITIQAYGIGTLISTRTAAWTLAVGTSIPVMLGDLTIDANATITGTTGTFVFSNETGTQTVTTNGVTISANLQQYSSILRLNGNVTIPSTNTFTLSQGTLDLTNNGAGNYTLSTGLFSSSNTNTRSISFGTGNITVTGNAGTIYQVTTATNLNYTGTPNINFTYSGSVGTRTISNGQTGGASTNAFNINISAGSDIVTLYTGTYYNNVNFSGFTGTLSNSGSTITLYGNLTFSSSMILNAGTQPFTFSATSGNQQLTSAGLTLDFPITQNNPGATLQLQDNLTMGSTRTFTLTAGTLDLNSKTLSTGIFSSSNTNTRSISFGTGNITVTGTNATVVSLSTGNNLSYTGTSNIQVTGAGTVGQTRNVNGPANTLGGTETNSFNYTITNGADTIAFGGTGRSYKNVTFTTGFTGIFDPNAVYIYGNLTLSTGGMTYASNGSGAIFAASSGTQQLTSAGLTIDTPLTQQNPGATLQLQDNLTLGSTRTYTHTSGTLDLNAKTATIGTFSSTGTATRAITFNSGTLSISGTTTSAFTASGSGLTTSTGTGVGTISMTAATAKTFAGGGFTYAAKLNQGGAGALTITGSNTFNDITNTTQPATVTFTSGTTTSVSNFSLSGTAGNLITINSSTPGSQFTLAKV